MALGPVVFCQRHTACACYEEFGVCGQHGRKASLGIASMSGQIADHEGFEHGAICLVESPFRARTSS